MKNTKLLTLIFLGIVIGVICNGGINGLTNNYEVGDDVRAALFLMQELPNSYLVEYSVVGSPATHILKYVYGAFGIFFDLIAASKIVSILLYIISIVLAFELAKHTGLKYPFIFAFLMMLQMGVNLGQFSFGMSKGFAIPLLFAFLLYFVKKQHLRMWLVMILSVLFYPPVFAISATTLGIEFLRKRMSFAKVFALSIIPTSLFLAEFVKGNAFGSRVLLKTATNMPEFYSGGRAPIFRGSIPFTNSIYDTLHSVINSYNFGTKPPIYADIFFIIGAACLILFLFVNKHRIKLSAEFQSLAAASLILFSLAILAFSKLYLPSRYIVFTFPIIGIWYLCKSIENLTSDMNSWKKGVIFIIILIVASGFCAPKIKNILTTCSDTELYSFLENLPENSLIAAHPKVADCIPLYTKRNVLFMDELNLPYQTKYYTNIKTSVSDFFNAYYSDSISYADEFCRKYSLSHIVVNKEHFSKEHIEKNNFYREPFNLEIKKIAREDAALPILLSNTTQYGNYYVFECPLR